MKKLLIIFTLIITIFIFNNNYVLAESKKIFISETILKEPKKDLTKTNTVNIYLFHSKTCSHCQQELKLLSKLKKKFKNIKVHTYEINNTDNKKLFEQVSNKLNLSHKGVPLTIIGDKYYIGYNEEKSIKMFTKTISYYSNYSYNDITKNIIDNKESIDDNKNQNEITVNEYIKKYDNYKILFLNTKNLDVSTNNLLLTILSELNIFNIIVLIILSFIIYKVKNNKQRLLCILLYLLTYIFPNIFNYINNYNVIVIKIMFLIILNYFVYSILLYIVKNKKNYIIYNIVMILSVISNYLKLTYHNNYINIFYKINSLYSITLYSNILEIIISIIIIFVFIIITTYISINLISLLYKFKNKISK